MKNLEVHKVLILDHGTGACEPVAAILTQNNVTVEVAGDLNEVKNKLDREQIGILLLYLTGKEFDEWIKKGEQLLNQFEIPVIFIVDAIDDERFKAIQRCNCYGFVQNNSDSYNLLQTLHFALKLFETRFFEEQKLELKALAATSSVATGKELFDSICKHLSDSLNVDYALIGEIIDKNDKCKVHSLFGDGKFLDQFEYSLENTPCAELEKKGISSYKSGVQQRFPGDKLLQQMNIEGYVGIPLRSSGGNPLGIAVLLNKKPLKNEKRCRQYLQIYSDRISAEMERLHAEAELREREEELRSINAHISEGIYRSTPKDGLIYVNDAFASMFGYDSPEDLLSLDGAKLYANEERRKELTEIENRKGFIKNEEVEFQRKDGSTFWGLMSGQVVQGEDGKIKYYDGSVLDITERKYAQEENRRLLKAIQQSPEAILITNAEGYIEYVNPKFLEETHSEEEELLNSLAPILDKNEITAPFFDEMWEIIQSGEIWSRTIKKPSEDKKTTWEKVTISPVFNGDEKITNYVIILNDITDRKERENKLQQSLSEKEILLAEIHHRVKNNLAIISGLLELAAQNQEPGNVVNSIFHESQLRIQSMAMIHEKLYQAGNFTNLKIENYITELVDYIKGTVNPNEKKVDIKIENKVDAQLNINQAIPCALMINELVTNAFKYAFNEKKTGKLNIHLQSKENKILLIVQDDGPGLPDDFEEKTQNSLGFVLIRQLTKQLQGELRIKNENGARFEILFEKSDQSGSSSAGYIIDRRRK